MLKSNNYKYFTYLLVLLLAVAVVAILFTFRATPKDNPPEIAMSTELLFGAVQTPRGFGKWVQSDVDAWGGFTGLSCTPTTMPAGVNYYYLSEAKTVEEILDRIEPKLNNKFLFAFYTPGIADIGQETGYYTYPGPYLDTPKLAGDQLIPANRGFAIILQDETQGCLESPKTAPSSFDPPDIALNDQWTLLPLNDCSELMVYENVLSSVWVQTGTNDFDLVDSANWFTSCLNNADYKMVWVHWKEGPLFSIQANFVGQPFTEPEAFIVGSTQSFFFNYYVNAPATVELNVYNTDNQVIYSAEQDTNTGSQSTFSWDGILDNGQTVSTGEYNYTLKIKDNTNSVSGTLVVEDYSASKITSLITSLGSDNTYYPKMGIPLDIKLLVVDFKDNTNYKLKIQNIDKTQTYLQLTDFVVAPYLIDLKWDGKISLVDYAPSGTYVYSLELFDGSTLVDSRTAEFQVDISNFNPTDQPNNPAETITSCTKYTDGRQLSPYLESYARVVDFAFSFGQQMVKPGGGLQSCECGLPCEVSFNMIFVRSSNYPPLKVNNDNQLTFDFYHVVNGEEKFLNEVETLDTTLNKTIVSTPPVNLVFGPGDKLLVKAHYTVDEPINGDTSWFWAEGESSYLHRTWEEHWMAFE